MKRIVLQALQNWGLHETKDKAASLTYYSLLSFAPIILLLLTITKWFALFGHDPVDIGAQLAGIFPEESQEFVMQFALQSFEAANIWIFLVTLGVLLWSSSRLVDGLDRAVNRIFGVRIDAEKKKWKLLVKKKGMHLLFVIVFVVLLLLSFILPVYLRLFFEGLWLFWGEYVLVVGVFTCLFTILLRWLPHVVISWKDAWKGGILLALLTVVGRVVMNYLFGVISFTNDFSVGGAIVLFLIWVQYTWSIILFGIEVIQSALAEKGTLEVKEYAVSVQK